MTSAKKQVISNYYTRMFIEYKLLPSSILLHYLIARYKIIIIKLCCTYEKSFFF